MNTSLHLLVSAAEMRGEVLILGQNLLLPSQQGLPPQFAAVVYAARDLRTDAPAAALLIKTVFSRPMMPVIRPGTPVWDDTVLPHIQRMLLTVSEQERQPRALRLGGISEKVATLLKQQPGILNGRGALLLPQIDSPQPVEARAPRFDLPGVPDPVPAFRPAVRIARPTVWITAPTPVRRAA